MRDRVRLLTVSACCVLALLPCPEARCQTGAGALVEELGGRVMLRQKDSGKSVRLRSPTDVARRLYPDDVLSCSRGARLRVRVGGEVRPINCPGSFTVPRPPAQPDRQQAALDAYGRIGGRHRSSNSQPVLVSPPGQYNVRPDSFVIRWVAHERRCRAALSIETPDGEVLWRRADVDARSGSLDPGAARQALRDYRAKSGAATLLLKLDDSCGRQEQSTFSLLTAEREHSLAEELAAWDKGAAPLLAHLGRASVYLDYELFAEAAEEYEAALALAPQSRDLLMKAIDAQEQAGNYARADALSRRLPK